jgi:hypothetical protein
MEGIWIILVSLVYGLHWLDGVYLCFDCKITWGKCQPYAEALTMDEYAMNHPAGRIGKRLILNVRDVMKPVAGLPLCGPEVGLYKFNPADP